MSLVQACSPGACSLFLEKSWSMSVLSDPSPLPTCCVQHQTWTTIDPRQRDQPQICHKLCQSVWLTSGGPELTMSIKMPVLMNTRCVDAGTSSRCEGVNSQGSKYRCGGAGPRFDSALWHFSVAPAATRRRPHGGNLPRAGPRRSDPSAPSSQGQPGGEVRGSRRVRRPERLRHRAARGGTYRRPLQQWPQQRQQRSLPLG